MASTEERAYLGPSGVQGRQRPLKMTSVQGFLYCFFNVIHLPILMLNVCGFNVAKRTFKL